MATFELGKISPLALVSAAADIGQGVTVGAFSIIHPGVVLGDNSVVGSHCVLGEPTSSFYGESSEEPLACAIGQNAIIRTHSVIYQGVTIGSQLRTGHRVTIREGSTIGDDVQIGTMSDLQGDLRIGDHVRVHSAVFIAQGSDVRNFVWLFPRTLLANDPHPPSDTCTQGPTIQEYAAVGAGATIMPGVEVGEHALVGAMSLVTRDVARESVVVGVPAEEVG